MILPIFINLSYLYHSLNYLLLQLQHPFGLDVKQMGYVPFG